MQSHTGVGRRWRRLSHKFGAGFFLGFVLLVIAALVGFIMYMLGSPDWRARW